MDIDSIDYEKLLKHLNKICCTDCDLAKELFIYFNFPNFNNITKILMTLKELTSDEKILKKIKFALNPII